MRTNRKTIAHNTDTLQPGLYFWIWKLALKFGGTEPDPDYPFEISTFCGFAIVLPKFKSVGFGVEYKRRKADDT